MDLKSKIRTIPNWPKDGVMFRDITTLLSDSEGFKYVIDQLKERYKDKDIDLIAGIESRGFIIGGALAYSLGKGFVPLRKPGKLPYRTLYVEYELEYGKDRMEIHEDAIKQGQKILLVDDLIATGGSSLAAIELIKKLGGNIVEAAFIINLPNLKGEEKLKGYNIFKLVSFEGE